MNRAYNLFSKLKQSLLNTRKKLGDNIMDLVHDKRIDTATLDKIKNQLLIADINIHTTKKIINNLRNYINVNGNCDEKSFHDTLRNEMLKIVTLVDKPFFLQEKKPFIMLIVGVNGVGKTTTIGKLAHYYRLENKTVMLAAGDTCRAAAADQLKILGERSGCVTVIKKNTTADSASIVFDAIKIAKIKSVDLLIIDTAGRLQNKIHAMEELKKIIRVIKKIDTEAPHEIVLVLDANIGQNSINQVRMFNEAIKITGIIMTKLDGSAKGGTLLSIADHFSIPIRYVGIGQNIDDLQPFISHNFVEAILKEQTQ
ncbi:signal recognition particle-docking protein FtsY [Blochmannia endosymbiont of Camponotus sp. C-003]|uniref:signal recognition particle-docking protein FtsY n=1 Tax=unclassified Candidatus Blochmanniella TaxID=711328 RepID=UPI00202445AA|nr:MULTISPECIES: signal recognition particle-docking protein FtsY [unclassified Candidatus Blochmannia]URJ23228.1 signal recognition particle-docking protein FtsY [Blochmannia endosymbiont of Camponotus sp. C-003]URJ28697.1 signal recognition particle-docking protein FtsY [Blochmannia endosymbiont of Camponotus sp. C-046]